MTSPHSGHGSDGAIGERIREARERAGMSAAQLARRVGVEKSSLDAWEAGERDPRANRLNTLAGLLGVSLGWLLEGMQEGAPDTAALTSEALQHRIERVRLALNEGLAELDEIERTLKTVHPDAEFTDPDADG
jgi:transcriptional regulator with XRE-family HTH domain